MCFPFQLITWQSPNLRAPRNALAAKQKTLHASTNEVAVFSTLPRQKSQIVDSAGERGKAEHNSSQDKSFKIGKQEVESFNYALIFLLWHK